MPWRTYFGNHFNDYQIIFQQIFWSWLLATWTVSPVMLKSYPIVTIPISLILLMCAAERIKSLLPSKVERNPISLFFWLALGIIYIISLLIVANQSVFSGYKILTAIITVILLVLLVLTTSLFIYDRAVLTHKKTP